MTELPNGWVETVLDEIAATALGKMLDAKQRTGLHQTPYLRNVNVRWGTFDLSDVATMDIEPRELDRVLAQPGDLVACEGGEPGRSAVWRGREAVALQKALHKIRPAAGVLPDYLALLLREQSSTGELDKLFTGTTIKHLPQEKLRHTRVPLAPTAEQERIVAAVEEAFSKIDAGEARLGTVRQLLKRMRDAVLAAAVTGRLVAQDPTETPATKLLADLGVAPTAHRAGLPPGWASVQLGDLSAVISGPAFKSSQFGGLDDGVRLLRGENIEPGSLRWRDTRTWPTDLLDGYEHLLVEATDIILAMDRPVISTGLKLAQVRPGDLPALLVQRVARIRPVRDDLGPYLWLVMQDRRFIAHLLGGQVGTQLPHITLRAIRDYELVVPGPDEMPRLLAEADRQMSVVEACERAVDVGLARAAATRRSVLSAAFDGRLVPQDPSDEPGSVLLERIRAERAAAPKTARRSRRTA